MPSARSASASASASSTAAAAAAAAAEPPAGSLIGDGRDGGCTADESGGASAVLFAAVAFAVLLARSASLLAKDVTLDVREASWATKTSRLPALAASVAELVACEPVSG